MHLVARVRRALWGIGQEISWATTHVREGRVAYMINVFAYRLLAVTPRVPGRDRVFRLQTTSGMVLFYRRNRGDIQGIREILIDEIYRLPEGATPSSLVDLGANIGIATVWLAREYSLRSLAAVEPIASNYELLERNCRANSLDVRLVCAAVGPQSGSTTFDVSGGSNMGRAGEGSLQVAVRGVEELIQSLNFSPDLLKMDVEGMEGELLTSISPQWIGSFRLVVMEMHPEYVDIGSLVRTICEQGFAYFEPVEHTSGLSRSKRERLFVRQPSSLHR